MIPSQSPQEGATGPLDRRTAEKMLMDFARALEWYKNRGGNIAIDAVEAARRPIIDRLMATPSSPSPAPQGPLYLLSYLIDQAKGAPMYRDTERHHGFIEGLEYAYEQVKSLGVAPPVSDPQGGDQGRNYLPCVRCGATLHVVLNADKPCPVCGKKLWKQTGIHIPSEAGDICITYPDDVDVAELAKVLHQTANSLPAMEDFRKQLGKGESNGGF
jgi:hypothetical protein